MIIITHPPRTIPGREYFDNSTQMFLRTKDIHIPAMCLKLEHSLISMSKWESKWHKPFNPEKMSNEELMDYIRCMNVNSSDNSDAYKYLSQKDIADILEYMLDPQTAWVDPREEKKKKPKKFEEKTVEEIYYAMANLNLDPEFYSKWHVNRLVALISYFDYMNSGSNKSDGSSQKMTAKTRAEILQHYHEMNQKARAKYKSKG